MNGCALGEVLFPPASASRNSAVALFGCAIAAVILGVDGNNVITIDRFRLLSLSQWLLILDSSIGLVVVVIFVAPALPFIRIFRHVKVDIVVLIGIQNLRRAVRVLV